MAACVGYLDSVQLLLGVVSCNAGDWVRHLQLPDGLAWGRWLGWVQSHKYMRRFSRQFLQVSGF